MKSKIDELKATYDRGIAPYGCYLNTHKCVTCDGLSLTLTSSTYFCIWYFVKKTLKLVYVVLCTKVGMLFLHVYSMYTYHVSMHIIACHNQMLTVWCVHTLT